MKKILSIIPILLTITLFLSSCLGGISSGEANAEETEVNCDYLQSENIRLKNDIEQSNRIYEDSLKSAITTYCKDFLSYDSTVTFLERVKKIEDITTKEYYDELLSQSGHTGNVDDYQQATVLDEIYYPDNSNPQTQIKVMAFCFQNIVYSSKSQTHSIYYVFNMEYNDGVWYISGVDSPVNQEEIYE